MNLMTETNYIDKHPGGKDILIKTKGQADITALFETYHAFSDKNKIMDILHKYKVDPTDNLESKQLCKYDFTNYNNLVNEVKKILPNRDMIKTNFFYVAINTIILFTYICTFYLAMFSEKYIIIRTLAGFISGLAYISLGFTTMHDASHYAISTNSNINIFLAKAWNSWGMWNYHIWFFHHVYNHHSHTGQDKQDPDLYHLRPFVRKTTTDQSIHPFFLHIQDKIAPIILFIFPGQYIGQVITYFLASFKNRVYKIKLPYMLYYDDLDMLLCLLHLYSLYKGLYLPTISYIFALNIWYAINIIPDHDTYESLIENHYDGNDWCKIQISNSANFVNDNVLWTYFFA